MKPAVTLAGVLGGRDNHLNLVRMIAATMVLVSHAYPITLGRGAVEPMVAITGESLGHHAVAIFFGISGLLIARSFDRRQTMVHFALARIFRLYPALLVVLLLTVICGAAITQLPAASYVTSAATWTYVPRNLSLAFLQYQLPGIFAANPYGPQINGSLWTLFYEVVCYGAVVVAGLLGLLRRPQAFAAFMVAVCLAYLWSVVAQPADGVAFRLDRLADLGFPFALGMASYVWRDRLILSAWIALGIWSASFLLAGTQVHSAILALAVIYSILWVSFVPKGPLLAYNRIGDFSYGTYIYAFPIQQLCVSLLPGQSPLANIAISLPLTVLCAGLSWHLIEARSLGATGPLAARLVALRQRRPAQVG